MVDDGDTLLIDVANSQSPTLLNSFFSLEKNIAHLLKRLNYVRTEYWVWLMLRDCENRARDR